MIYSSQKILCTFRTINTKPLRNNYIPIDLLSRSVHQCAPHFLCPQNWMMR